MGLQRRKRNRLREYNYNLNGSYFITICTKDKKQLFWKYDNRYTCYVGANFVRQYSESWLSNIGIIVDNEIKHINSIYKDSVYVDKYVIMPNHIHMIITIDVQPDGRTQFAPTVSRVTKQFKGSVTKRIGVSVWQKSFYDHIIRNEVDYLEKWNYIHTNPHRWNSDELYVEE